MHIIDRTHLRSFDFGWIKLTDHFISTVGPSAGTGKPHGHLLVLADAVLSSGASFPMHAHENMEILTWVVSGTLHHKDNQGGDQFVPSGSLQLMSARDGIYHAEGNSDTTPLRLLQIWIRPSKQTAGQAVVLQQPLNQKGFGLLASSSDAPLLVEQKVELWAAILQAETQTLLIKENTMAYGVSIGDLEWNGIKVSDGAGIRLGEGKLEVKGTGQAVIIVQEIGSSRN